MGGPLIIPEGARPITRGLLASFLEYAIAGKLTSEEVRRFINTPYDDPKMTFAVQELQRLIPHTAWCNRTGTPLDLQISQDAIDRIHQLARELRSDPNTPAASK